MPNGVDPSRLKPGHRRFNLASLFLIVLGCAIALGWYVDRRRLQNLLMLAEAQKEALRTSGRTISVISNRPAKVNTCATPEEFIAKLRSIKNWYEFADDTVDPFVKTPIADTAVPQLVELLADNDPEVRRRALATLGKMKRHSDVIVPALIPLLHDEVLNNQWHAAFALAQFGTDASEAIPAIESRMMDDDCGVAAFCASMIYRIDPARECTPRVVQLLSNPIKSNREEAIFYLSRHGDEQIAAAALTNAFEAEPDEQLRKKIAQALNSREKHVRQ